MCICKRKYTGHQCETYSACSSNPCKHGGICKSVLRHYKCKCRGYYTGINCATSSLNVAYKKNTAQSSTQYGEYGGSEHAVDGNRNQLFPAKSCTHTYRSTNPWWWVDLGGEYVVRKVTITVRNDCTTCANRLNGLSVVASASPDGSISPKLCTQRYLKFRRGETKHIACQAKTVGKYVRISVPGKNKSLSMCEVEVFGKKVIDQCKSNPCQNGGICEKKNGSGYMCICKRKYIGYQCETYSACSSNPCKHGGTCKSVLRHYTCKCRGHYIGINCGTSLFNVAYKKNTNQSSTQHGQLGVAEHAVDGNKNTKLGGKSCTETQLSANPWWWVDLGGEYEIWKVIITVREDCSRCYKRLDGMKVVASSSPSGHKYSTSCTKHYLKFRRGETKRISCQANTFGKYVRISVPGNRTTLSLCEVEVYGSKDSRDDLGTDVCQSRPCKNNATCTRKGRHAYLCSCMHKYSGLNCESYDECFSHPCKNGGSCTMDGKRYKCKCPRNYMGVNCQKAPRVIPKLPFPHRLAGYTRLD
ncbi:hypothetical protein LSAT2_019169 [Lamellibrachia satsuma]|nr:hypothetical protein LSAT2_019169 [Lamellibrachia satsuma]